MTKVLTIINLDSEEAENHFLDYYAKAKYPMYVEVIDEKEE